MKLYPLRVNCKYLSEAMLQPTILSDLYNFSCTWRSLVKNFYRKPWKSKLPFWLLVFYLISFMFYLIVLCLWLILSVIPPVIKWPIWFHYFFKQHVQLSSASSETCLNWYFDDCKYLKGKYSRSIFWSSKKFLFYRMKDRLWFWRGGLSVVL